MDNFKICSRCIYDSKTPGISFDLNNVCNYCHQIDQLKIDFKTGTTEGKETLERIIKDIKAAGKNKKYDCVVGVSGGTDSSFLLYKCVEWGLRPLAVHYDNTWNSAIATENIRKITSLLKVDLYTHVIDNKESDDIFRSFFLANVPEFDAATDMGFAQVIRKTAAKFGIKYVLEGHSFVEEGVSPMGKNYFDGKYIADIHSKFGKVKLKTYPLMTFLQFMKWILVYRQKFIRPLWYINYSKKEAKQYLKLNFGWNDYSGHHLENRSSAFVHLIYHPQKFNIDNRNWTLSALARSGELSREEALKIYNTPLGDNKELETYVIKRLGVSEDEYVQIMNGPKKSFKDYKTYKKRFEMMRPLFYFLAKANIIPSSFYIKYCFPLNEDNDYNR